MIKEAFGMANILGHPQTSAIYSKGIAPETNSITPQAFKVTGQTMSIVRSCTSRHKAKIP